MLVTRLPDPEPGSFPPGYDEGQWQCWRCQRGSFDLNVPGIGLACLAKHSVIEHPDGTITAAPSILLTGHRGQAHGYLERSRWRFV